MHNTIIHIYLLQEKYMKQMKIGLLPFYLKLYDDENAECRPRIDEFLRTIISAFSMRGIQVETAPVCRIKMEFENAITRFEASAVDAIVTIHMAYSPSLESSGVLARTKIPLLVLDTTPTWSYSAAQDPVELMYNHGIHGVQDMCNVLVQNGIQFLIEAGHWERSDVLDRIIAHLPAARAASVMRQGRVGLIGEPFPGMGDFAVSPTKLRETIGGELCPFDPALLQGLMESVSDTEITVEAEKNLKTFTTDNLDPDVHRRSIRLGLAIRRWIEKEKLDAFTFNFQNMEKARGYPTVPFLEASAAMSRGIGFAGEGDVLTALFVASVMALYEETSFTEMFCPDWENDVIFLSHMGEMNWKLTDGKASLREMDYEYDTTDNPAYVSGRFKPGKITLANLAPIGGNAYRLIIVQGSMLPVFGEDRMDGQIRGWFKPELPLADFLTEYSKAGGTHHLALAYTESIASLLDFARLMGWETAIIKN